MVGQIFRSINNFYNVYVKEEDKTYQCRIKGKVLKLKEEEVEYNPIAVGDLVDFEPHSENEGLILSRIDRKSYFTRWNLKNKINQTLASNMDQLVIVTSADMPPFRPRFTDRAIACAKGCDILIVLNKCDYEMSDEMAERWLHYADLGYKTVVVSAKENEGIEALIKELKGKVNAFVGQSGVGKSTLVNLLLNPDKAQVTNEISEKFQRGRHTTNHALYLQGKDFDIIDTPGIRELYIPHYDLYLIKESFPEFNNAECEYPTCLHRDEENCSVKRAVEEGDIMLDRYESYLRMLDSVEAKAPTWESKKYVKKKSF